MKRSKAVERSRADRPAPTTRQSEAMRRAAERYRERRSPPEYCVPAPGETKLSPWAMHSDDAGHVLQILDTFGTASADFAQQGVGRVAAAMRAHGNAMPDGQELNAGIAAVAGIAPENETEAMLAIQMVATHECAMDMLARAKQANTYEKMEICGGLATKLLRTYTQQIEALAKMRRNGSQKVVVEHVHVYPGGQAIVGNVTQGGGARDENGHQPHALSGPATGALPADPSMLRPDAGREPMSVAGGEGQGAMPNARRGQGKRRARG